MLDTSAVFNVPWCVIWSVRKHMTILNNSQWCIDVKLRTYILVQELSALGRLCKMAHAQTKYIETGYDDNTHNMQLLWYKCNRRWISLFNAMLWIYGILTTVIMKIVYYFVNIEHVTQFIENVYNKRKRTLYNLLRLNYEYTTPTYWLFDMKIV